MTYCGGSGGAGGLYGLTEEDSSQHSWEAEPAGGWKLAHVRESPGPSGRKGSRDLKSCSESGCRYPCRDETRRPPLKPAGREEYQDPLMRIHPARLNAEAEMHGGRRWLVWAAWG